jgi:hypothetical protein
VIEFSHQEGLQLRRSSAPDRCRRNVGRQQLRNRVLLAMAFCHGLRPYVRASNIAQASDNP